MTEKDPNSSSTNDTVVDAGEKFLRKRLKHQLAVPGISAEQKSSIELALSALDLSDRFQNLFSDEDVQEMIRQRTEEKKQRIGVVISLETKREIYQGELGKDLVIFDLEKIRTADVSGKMVMFGLDVRGGNFEYTNLSSAILIASDFSHANLSHTDLRGADCRGVDFSYADLSNAKIDETTKLEYATLDGAKLPEGFKMKE